MMIQKLKTFTKLALILAFVSLGAVPLSHVSAQTISGGGSAAAPAAAPAATTPAATGSLDCNGTNLKPGTTTTDPNCVPPAPVITTSTGSALITSYLNPFIKLLTVLVGVAVTVGVIYGGIQYSMSAGDPQKAASGRKHVRDAVIALVAYALVLSLLNFLIPGGILV